MILDRLVPKGRLTGTPADPNMQPHVLVVTDLGDGEKEWEVEHPECCPWVCWWAPTTRDAFYENRAQYFLSNEEHLIPWRFGCAEPLDRDPGGRSCYVAYEIEHNGIDSLDPHGVEGVELAPKDPERPFAPDWLLVPQGRYLIEGWYTPFCWAGSEPLDADGGLRLMGRAL